MSDNFLQSPDGGVGWNAAQVDMPPMPSIQPGEDGLSMTIAAALAEMHAGLEASVASTSAKENMFSGKVQEAKGMYQNADDQGSQSVGQMGQMLGQVGQMAQQAGKAGGGGEGGSSIFSSLMEQAMKAVQGAGGSHEGSPAEGSAGQSPDGGQPAGGMAPAGQQAGQPAGQSGQPSGGAPAHAPQQKDDAAANHERPRETRESQQPEAREEKPREAPAPKPPVEAAGPGELKHGAGPAPVAPPQHTRPGGEDLSRRM